MIDTNSQLIKVLNFKFNKDMKRIFFIRVTFFLLLLNYSCKNEKSYFNGTISVDNDFNITDSIKGEKINLEDIYTGYMSVYDSVITFISAKYPDKEFYAFNLNSRKHTGSFFPKGQGPGYFYSITHTEQYVLDSSIKLWVRDDVLTGKYFLFNITRSIQEQTTLFDSTFVFNWQKEWTRPFAYTFFLDNGHILVKNQPEELYQDDKKFEEIAIDPVNELLYAKNNDDEDIYRYQISNLAR